LSSFHRHTGGKLLIPLESAMMTNDDAESSFVVILSSFAPGRSTFATRLSALTVLQSPLA